MDNSNPERHPAKRRWFAFSLRTLLIVVTLAAIWLGYLARAARMQNDAVAAVKKWSNDVRISYDRVAGSFGRPPFQITAARWLSDLVGFHFYGSVINVSAVNIRQSEFEAGDKPARMDFTPLRQFTRLKYLAVGGTRHRKMECEDLQNIAELSDLENVALVSHRIDDNGLRYLTQLNQLTILNLPENQVSDHRQSRWLEEGP